MRAPWFAWSIVLAAACAGSGDDWVVRPPGGGTGNGIPGVDAMPRDAPGGDGGGLTGLVCVVTDLRTPDACPALAAAGGVLVRKLGDSTGATTDASGRFTLAVTGDPVILDVGAGAATLARSVVPVANDGRLVQAPVPTQAAWTAALTATGGVISAGDGAIVVYTEANAGGAASGVTYDLPPGAASGPFYDRAGGAWDPGGGTGAAGATIILDLPPGSYTLSGGDGAGATVTLTGVPVAADAITFVRGRLSP